MENAVSKTTSDRPAGIGRAEAGIYTEINAHPRSAYTPNVKRSGSSQALLHCRDLLPRTSSKRTRPLAAKALGASEAARRLAVSARRPARFIVDLPDAASHHTCDAER
jgi:hypothetical protein